MYLSVTYLILLLFEYVKMFMVYNSISITSDESLRRNRPIPCSKWHCCGLVVSGSSRLSLMCTQNLKSP